MLPRDWRVRLEDMLEAIDHIQRYTAGMSFDHFRANQMAVDAVIRNLTVLGEAARHVPQEIQLRYREVPWLDIGDTRNVLAHEYFGVSVFIIWETVSRDLPTLADQLRTILKQESQG